MKTLLLFCALTTLLGCESFTLERRNFANCIAPSATIGATLTRLQADLFLQNPSTDIRSVSWDFGDTRALPQTGVKTAYSYEKAGTYLVKATLTNSCSQTALATRSITVTN